jgi:hypothetical protein
VEDTVLSEGRSSVEHVNDSEEQHRAWLDEVVEAERQTRYWQARQLHALAELAAEPNPDPLCPPGLDKHWVREEVSCALKMSPDAARYRLALAAESAQHFPELVKLLESGEVSLAHVTAFSDNASALEPEEKRQLLALVLERAGRQSITTFRRAVRKALHEVRPLSIEKNREALAAERRIFIKHSAEGMSELTANLPTEDALALAARVEDLAQQWSRQRDEQRTMAQLRADAMIHLVCSDRTGAPVRPVGVNVCVALSTLVGADDAPAELVAGGVPAEIGGGIVPITAWQARLLAFEPGSTWRRLITDPRGVVLDYGRTVYRPPAPLARFVRARDRHCRFPHCNRPAIRCDLDHRRDWDHGGTTCPCNIECLCKRHHHLKHETGCTVTLLDDGTTRWTSPTGQRFDQEPETYPVATGQVEDQWQQWPEPAAVEQPIPDDPPPF